MSPKILALIENNIGMTLLLSSRLKALGYTVTILSTPAEFQKQVNAHAFDWIILDDAALPLARRRFLEHLQRHRKEARIAWCGKPPRWTGVPIEGTFEKPLQYAAIERFFSRWTASDARGASDPAGANPWKAVGPPHSSEEEGRKTSADTSGSDGATEGDEG